MVREQWSPRERKLGKREREGRSDGVGKERGRMGREREMREEKRWGGGDCGGKGRRLEHKEKTQQGLACHAV